MSRSRRQRPKRNTEPRTPKPPRPSKPDVIEDIEIVSVAAGGDGVGRLLDGRVVFARLTAPGDLVRVTAKDEGAAFLRATQVEVLKPSESRVEPRCKVFGECGGCAWQHIAYEDQVQAKRKILTDAVSRIGKFSELPPVEFVASKKPYGYRARTRLLATPGKIGYRRLRDHEIEAVDACPVLLPEVSAALSTLSQERAADHAADSEAFESETSDTEIELAAGSDRVIRSTYLVAGERRDKADKTRIDFNVGGESVGISPGGFSQGNLLLHEELYGCVVRGLGAGSKETLLELFAGAGFFTTGMARKVKRVIAVESDRIAVGDLKHNLVRAEITNVRVIKALAEKAMKQLANAKPDMILLDPPRIGLVRGAAERLASLGAKRIVYVSCDPATLARDLRILSTDPKTDLPRYKLSALTGFDLFPQTPHVEAVAVLDRVG